MDERVLRHLRSPRAGLSPLHSSGPPSTSGQLLDGTLSGPDGSDPSVVRGGIWEAIADRTPPRSLARLSNVVAPWPQLYESVWRPRSTPLLTHGALHLGDELAEMDAALADVDGAFVIDVGCAEGLMSRRLAKRGAQMLAVDYSRPLLKRARMRAARDGVTISLCQAVAQSLPVLDGHADAIVMGGTLNEIGDMRQAIREVARALAGGGTFFCVSLLPAPTRIGRMAQRAVNASGIFFPTEAATLELFEGNGLRVDEQRITGTMSRVRATKIGGR